MVTKSAGVLLYRFKNKSIEVFLVHPGGPFWKNKDLGIWSIPKGEYTDEEDSFAAAKREFEEETGSLPIGEFIKLTDVKQKSGKIISVWALEGNIDHENIRSNTFELEWPSHSGKKENFPEIDKAGWFSIKEAKEKIYPGQLKFVDELTNLLLKKE